MKGLETPGCPLFFRQLASLAIWQSASAMFRLRVPRVPRLPQFTRNLSGQTLEVVKATLPAVAAAGPKFTGHFYQRMFLAGNQVSGSPRNSARRVVSFSFVWVHSQNLNGCLKEAKVCSPPGASERLQCDQPAAGASAEGALFSSCSMCHERFGRGQASSGTLGRCQPQALRAERYSGTI